MPEPDPIERPVREVLKDAGSHLGFTVKTEVEASESAYVDLVWFDSRFPIPPKNFKMRYALVLPTVGFEIEKHTALNAKHVKGSVSNLNNLGAQLGVIVVGDANVDRLQNSPPYKDKDRGAAKKALCERLYRWVYAEAQPTVRIIVMFEDEVRAWAKSMQPDVFSHATQPEAFELPA